MAQYAKSIIIGFGRMNGRTVGVVANQPRIAAGIEYMLNSVEASKFELLRVTDTSVCVCVCVCVLPPPV